MGQAIQEMQMMMERMKLQLEKEEVDIKRISAFGEIAEAQADLKAKLFIELAKLRGKGGESSQAKNVDLFKTIFQEAAKVHLQQQIRTGRN